MRPHRSVFIALLAPALLAAAGSLSAATGSTLETVTGTVRLLAVDDRDPSAATDADGLITTAVADVGGRLIDLPADAAAGLRAGDAVTMTVTTRGRSSAVTVRSVIPALARTTADGGTQAGRVSAASVAGTVLGAHTLTVLPVYWDQPDDEAPKAVLSELAARTAEYWSDQSGGRIAITPTVREWVRITTPVSCTSSALSNAALAAHRVALPTTMNAHVMVYFPRRADCGGWAGLGEVGGPMTFINGYPLLDVTAHELGHNLGLGHANRAGCTSGSSRVTLSSSCTVTEYYDYADVMGVAMNAPTGNLNTALAGALGLAQTVTAAAGARTAVDLAPLARTDGLRAVRIRVPSGWVYLDYRPAAGRDDRMPSWAGVQAHLLPDATTPASQLLDGQPRSGVPFSAVALPVGTSWSVPGSGLSVTVTSTTSTGARLEVAPDGAAPVVPTPVITMPTSRVMTGPSVTVGWRVASTVTTIRAVVDGQQLTSTSAAGLTGIIRVNGLTSGSHTLTLQAADATGQLSAISAAVGVITDLTPPSTPTGLTLSSARALRWRPSTDALSGVAGYLVSLDGRTPTRLGNVTTLPTTPPVGRHTYWVAGVDRVGNVSPATGLVVTRTSASGARASAARVVAAAEIGGGGQRTLVTGRTVGASRAM